MKTLTIQEMQDAAKRIEIDADEAYRTVTRLYGEDVAKLLLIAHLRRAFGAMDQYPPSPDINQKVEDFLREKGIL
jgi:hypothetical protein